MCGSAGGQGSFLASLAFWLACEEAPREEAPPPSPPPPSPPPAPSPLSSIRRRFESSESGHLASAANSVVLLELFVRSAW